MTFAQWRDDWRWVMTMLRARRYRRTLLFSGRKIFDDAFRPPSSIAKGCTFVYPDAFYLVKYDDYERAKIAVLLRGYSDDRQ